MTNNEEYECPVPPCDRGIVEDETFDPHRHFVMSHNLYEQRYTMLKFLEKYEFKEYTDVVDDSSGVRFDLEFTHKQIKSGVRNHPAFTIELYEELFESIEAALKESRTACLDSTDYEIPEEHQMKSVKEKRREGLVELSTPQYDKYGRNYEEQREKAINRDGFECTACGDSDCTSLQIHHIKPASYFHEKSTGDPDYETMNEISNLVTLCASCHGTLEGKWEDSDRDEFVEQSREYLGPRTELSSTVSDS